MAQFHPQIYIASLCDYNAGFLHGAWVDASLEVDQMQEEISNMLKNSPAALKYGEIAEEWSIHDYEDFGDIKLSEYESLETVSKMAQLLIEHGSAYAAYISYHGIDEATEEGFLNSFCGIYPSEEDFVQEQFTQIYEIPEHLEFYIDWKSMARDWFINDYYSVLSNNELHIFSYN